MEAGTFKTSVRATLYSSISMPCSSPHCCPSCLTPSFNTTTLLYPKPLITGFEIAGPVLSCVTPGVLLNASIKLVDALLNKSSLRITLIGVGVFLEDVALIKLVTVAFAFSITA